MCQKWFLGVLSVKMWKYCLLTLKRHYPAWMSVCWCIACQNRFNGLSSRSVEKFCVYTKKKMSGNFSYMGRSNPWGDLDQMLLVGRYGGRNHVCNISWLSIKGCGCGERGKFVFSHWLDASPLQHWSQIFTIVCAFWQVCLVRTVHRMSLTVFQVSVAVAAAAFIIVYNTHMSSSYRCLLVLDLVLILCQFLNYSQFLGFFCIFYGF